MVHKIKKPKGTFYSDYTIENGKCYAIFEYDNQITHKFVCNTNKQLSDFKTFDIKETDTHLIINLNE